MQETIYGRQVYMTRMGVHRHEAQGVTEESSRVPPQLRSLLEAAYKKLPIKK